MKKTFKVLSIILLLLLASSCLTVSLSTEKNRGNSEAARSAAPGQNR